jgi:uncharacterized protein
MPSIVAGNVLLERVIKTRSRNFVTNMKINTNSPFFFNAHDLPRRAGEFREYSLTITLPEAMGIPMLSVPKNENLAVELRITSVDEGIFVSGQVSARAHGECTRCLDPVGFEIDQMFNQLYEYEEKAERIKKNAKPDDEEDEEILFLTGDFINLEIPLRDAIVLALPSNPLCDEECAGLCSGCGEKWAILPADHSHQGTDPRWSGLANWPGLTRE